MANSRDVRLTIRARDEASKVIAKVGEALNQYANGTDKVGKSLVPLKDRFSAATKSVADLHRTLTKTSGQLGINRQYQIITGEIAKMTAELSDNKAALQQNSDQLAKAKTQLEGFKQSRDQLRQTLAAEKKQLTEANRAVDSHTKALASAEEQSRELTAEIARKEEVLRKSRDDLQKSTQAQRLAEEADQKAIRTTDVLTQRLGQLRAEREAQRRTLTGSSGMTARTERIGRIADASNDPWAAMAARSFSEDEGAVRARLVAYDREIQRIEGLRDAAKRAQQESSRNLTQQVQATREISRQMVSADNLGTLRARLAQTQASISEHTQKLTTATAAQTRLNASVDAGEKALAEQNAEIQIAHNDLQKMDSENRKLASSVERTTGAIEKSNAALNELQANAKQKGFGALGQSVDDLEKRLARMETRYQQTLDVLTRAGRYHDGGGNFTGSEDAAKLRKLNDELRRAQDDAAAFKNEIKELNNAIARGDGGREEMKKDIRSLSQALAAAEADARQLTVRIREVSIASGSMRANVFDIWRKHNQDSRTALNLYQRLRGQVLSMIAAYGGLYGVARAVQSVSRAFMVQEAALSRLGVVFDGNQQRMGVELDWIRRQAQRLGIEFGVLSQEYTKFAVGASASGFSDDSIRTIFLAVAEAGRVNKLSIDDLEGTFLALSQMIGKSKISAEELRQQLGERLPGAVRIVADALGLTIAELDDLMKKGQVFASEENMLKIAAELDRVFGQQLPASLNTFTAEWGRLENTMFQSRVLIGRGGLIDALTDAMQRLNDFANTEEGVKFFLAIGAAMGDVASNIPVLIENFDNIVKVLKVLMTIGIAAVLRRWMLALAPLALAIGSSLMALARAPAAFMLFNSALWSSTTAMGAAGVAARGLAAALMTLGPLVAALAIGGAIFGAMSSWEDSVDNLVELQAQHERIMDSILQKYEEAKDKTYDWRDAIADKNREELRLSLQPNLDAFNALQQELAGNDYQWVINLDLILGSVNGVDGLAEQYNFSDDVRKQIQDMRDEISASGGVFNLGTAGLTRLADALALVADNVPDQEQRDHYSRAASAIREYANQGNVVSEIATVMRELGMNVADMLPFMDRFSTSIEEMASGVNGTADDLANFRDQVETQLIAPLEQALREAGAFEEGFDDLDRVIKSPFDGGEVSIREMITALDALKEKVPEIATAFQMLAADGSIEALANSLSWMMNIPVLGGMFQGIIGGQYGSNVPEDLRESERFGPWAETGLGWMIRAYEEYRGTAYADQNETGGFSAWRVGYGSDTVTDANTGQVRRTQQGETISRADAEADLMRRINGYIANIVSRIGQQRWDSFSDEQREVLLSLAHNYGTIPARIMNVVRDGTASEIATAIRGEIRAGSVNNSRRGEEAAIFERGGVPSSDPYQDAYEERQEEAARLALEAERAAQARADEYTSLNQSLEIERLRADGQEREAFIMERINQFRERHGEIGAEELANLREQYGTLYDLQNVRSADEQLQEQIREHQEVINRLETERNALLEQREHYKEAGDTDKVAEINERLQAVNAELNTAIDAFIAFWAASGSEEAQGSIAALEAMRLGLQEAGKEALITADQINEKWATGLSNAFSAMAEAIATGENAWDSFRDAFMQFAGEFLIEIGKMIVQQTILNMLQGMGPSGSGGFGGGILGMLGSITTGLFHSGKGPGPASTGMRRTVPAGLFNGASRFHQGKLPGLRSGEMAAIITEDEEVLPPSDPRHAWNLGSAGGNEAPVDGGMTVVNAFDAESFLEAGLATPRGRKLFTNFVKANKSVIKGALE